MTRIWITNGTPTMPGLLNPVTAACDNGYVPDEARILSNPGVADSVAAASEMFETIIDAYGGDATASKHSLETEQRLTSVESSNSISLQSKQPVRTVIRLPLT